MGELPKGRRGNKTIIIIIIIIIVITIILFHCVLIYHPLHMYLFLTIIPSLTLSLMRQHTKNIQISDHSWFLLAELSSWRLI